METKHVEQNLLFALVAMKLGLIGDEALIAVLNAWSTLKDRPMSRILVERCSLAEAKVFLCEETYRSLLEANEGNPVRCLDALRLPPGQVAVDLARIVDPGLRDALGRVVGQGGGW